MKSKGIGFLVGAANFFVYPLIKLYWNIFSPAASGVKVFIQHKDRVLFIRNSYGLKYWTLPGGGVKKNESLEEAAKREAKEEVGIMLNKVVNKGSFFYAGEGKKDTITVFFAEVDSDEVAIDNFEVKEASWKNINSLTLSKSPVAKKCFELVGYKL